MSGEINVISRTQHIIVDPPSSSVSIINAGPIGPAGPQGPGPLGPILEGVQNGPFTLVQGNFQPIPGGGITKSFALVKPGNVLIVISAYIDTGVGVVQQEVVAPGNEVGLALNVRGANTSSAGSVPHRVLRCGGKQPVSSTVSLSYVQLLNPGTTYVDLYQKAQLAGAILSDVVLTVIVIP